MTNPAVEALKSCHRCGQPQEIHGFMLICNGCGSGTTFASGDERPGREFVSGPELIQLANRRAQAEQTPVAVSGETLCLNCCHSFAEHNRATKQCPNDGSGTSMWRATAFIAIETVRQSLPPPSGAKAGRIVSEELFARLVDKLTDYPVTETGDVVEALRSAPAYHKEES